MLEPELAEAVEQDHAALRAQILGAGGLAYVHEIERGRVRQADAGDELRPFALRVTQVWRRQDEGGGSRSAMPTRPRRRGRFAT